MSVENPSFPADEIIPPEIIPVQTEQEHTNASVARASAILALGNIFSRILGLARETVLTFLFGATGAVDAFQVAIIVPKAIYDLLIGGHINGAIVPVLSEVITVHGKEELWRVVSILISLVTVMLALLVILLEVFAPQVVQVVAGGADAATLRLATHLIRLTAPALIFMGLFAIFSGALYALRSFSLPAFAGVIFNGAIVGVMLFLSPPVQLIPDLTSQPSAFPFLVARPASGITVVAFGWFIGALAQMLLQMIGLKVSRLRITFNWRHPALKGIMVLYAPVMFSLIMDTLVIRPFSYNIASQTGEGSIAYMNWATTLIQFPQGLVATAISLAILPTLARQAVQIQSDTLKAFKDTLGLGLRLTTTLILPAAIGLFMLSTPIIGLLFQHGAFTAADTEITGHALRLYLVGLPFAAIDLLLVYAFYARKDTLTPALIGVLSLIVYMLTTVLLVDQYGLFSLMIADSVKHFVHALVSAALLGHRIKGFGAQRLWLTFAKTLFASLVMGAAVWLTLPLLTKTIGSEGLIREALLVILSGVLYGGIFMALAMILHIDELRWLGSMLKRRLLG